MDVNNQYTVQDKSSQNKGMFNKHIYKTGYRYSSFFCVRGCSRLFLRICVCLYFWFLIYTWVSVIGLVRLAEYTVPQPKRLQSKPPLARISHFLYDNLCLHIHKRHLYAFTHFRFNIRLTVSCFLAPWLRAHDVQSGNKLAQR